MNWGGGGGGGGGQVSLHFVEPTTSKMCCTIPSIVDDVTVVLPSCSDTLVMTTINK